MRPSSDYFDELDDVAFRGAPRLQRMIKEQRHKRNKAKSGHRVGPGDEWDDDWDDYEEYDDDYPDYNEEEFDRHSVSRW